MWVFAYSFSPKARIIGRRLRYGFIATSLLAGSLSLAIWWNDPFRFLTPERHFIHEWLEVCPKNDIRFACYSRHEDRVYGYVDFKEGNLGVNEDDYGAGGGITITIGPDSLFPTSINPAQEAEIQRLIQIMPERKVGAGEKYDFNQNIYFAIWKNHVLQTYVYPKNDLPPEMKALLDAFGPNLMSAIMPK